LLQRILTTRSTGACLLALLALGLSQCVASSSGGETIGESRQAVVGGALVDAASSPVLFLQSPGGSCSSVLVAPNLVATARHCIAPLDDTGAFACTASGDLADGSTAGQLGAEDYAPGTLSFFTSESVANGQAGLGLPADAVGSATLSTATLSVCSDDLAFVVLKKPIAGIPPAPIRVGPTEDGEAVDVFGYGYTQTNAAPLALRVSENTKIVGIGPSTPTDLTQPAPLRAIRVGPGTTTCNGDSGGPVMSKAGQVIAIVSLGLQTSNGASCPLGDGSPTTGPLLTDYHALIERAFKAAGASPPWGEPGDGGDGGSSPGAETGGEHVGAEAGSSGDVGAETTGGASCAVRPATTGSSLGSASLALALAAMVRSVGRRRRR